MTKIWKRQQKFRIAIELLVLKDAIQKFNGNQDEFEETVV